ncbi:glycosyltransferase family 2 protein [Novosphingobium sp. PhB55]|uniref:glycosyltransferase family 2 protein n=1 Tax=Novosphingobium sp. PhB55 TaxID=2485106 RepID=UPI00106710A1|nr:glycosyltransferase family 2 protein [Novosphingobium sp. PhB55]
MNPVMQPKLSVILAAYNCADFVERSIGSALDQQGLSVEIVAVNDCSTDATLDVLQAIARKDPRLRVIDSKENLGPSGARNLAFDHAAGEWGAVLDADDALEPGALSRLVQIAEDRDADIVAGSIRFFSHQRQEVSGPVFQENAPITTLSLGDFVEAARPANREPDYGLLKPLFRIAFLNDNGLRYRTDIRHGEDFHFIIDALSKGAKYVLAREVLSYIYTTRDSGLSRTRVDYSRMISETEKLSRRAPFASNPAVAGALTRRADALRTHELNVLYGDAPNLSSKLGVLAKSLTSSAGQHWLKTKIVKYVGR